MPDFPTNISWKEINYNYMYIIYMHLHFYCYLPTSWSMLSTMLSTYVPSYPPPPPPTTACSMYCHLILNLVETNPLIFVRLQPVSETDRGILNQLWTWNSEKICTYLEVIKIQRYDKTLSQARTPHLLFPLVYDWLWDVFLNLP